MIRRLLRKLGRVRTSLILTAISILSSIFFYMIVGILLGEIVVVGIFLSIIAPAILSSLFSYPFLGLLLKLDLAERALIKSNNELELRVKQRTVELVKANEELQTEITERKRAEEQIAASLKEKEVLLKEIHHRVKNNLQIISSLLHLQSKDIKAKETLEMFKDSQNRVRSMALIHEGLYQSKNLARIDFAEYIRNLANYLFWSYGVNSDVIRLKINTAGVFLDIDTAIPCGLIINELVSNTLKHAFPESREGEIRIGLRSQDGQFALAVSDNGIGFPAELDFRRTESLGLKLVIMLVEQLEGTIELDRRCGTTFKIAFTEPQHKERG